MLYGVEICGLEAIEQVQMCAFCMFFGVGTLHPKVSLCDDEVEISTCSVRGKSEVRAVLV